MKKSPLLTTLKTNFEKKHPFVVYASPQSSTMVGLFQKSNKTTRWDTDAVNGFAFIPFREDESSYFIPRDECTIFQTGIPVYDSLAAISLVEEEFVQQAHIELVNKAIAEIQNSELEKVVIARKIDLPLSELNLITLTLSLLSEYTSSFRYVWFHPATGLWCGASPELLLELDSKEFKTMSLAGTQKILPGEVPQWTSKELEEQQIVTREIEKELSPLVKTIALSEVYTQKAGTIAHLRTDITGKLNHTVALIDVLHTLHPTAAVCGYPRELAMKFIKEQEGLKRSFYTGFMGIVGSIKEKSTLYVNLRCMQIDNGMASIYVGGGITAESDPNDEWEETSNKRQTMLKVLQQFL